MTGADSALPAEALQDLAAAVELEPDQAQQRRRIREDPDHVPGPVFGRKVLVGQQVLGRVSEQCRRLREARLQAVDDLLELRQGAGVVRLREEEGPDDRRDGFAGSVGHQRQQIPHEMHAASR